MDTDSSARGAAGFLIRGTNATAYTHETFSPRAPSPPLNERLRAAGVGRGGRALQGRVKTICKPREFSNCSPLPLWGIRRRYDGWQFITHMRLKYMQGLSGGHIDVLAPRTSSNRLRSNQPLASSQRAVGVTPRAVCCSRDRLKRRGLQLACCTSYR